MSADREATAVTDGRLVSEALAYTVIDAAQNLLALAVVPASLFWLTPADMGVVTLAIVGTQVALTIGALGLDFGVVRFYLQWPEAEREARIRGVFLIVATASAALTAASILGAMTLWPAAAGAIVASVSAGAGLAIRSIPLSVFRVTSQLRAYARVTIGGSLLQAVLQIAALAAGYGSVGFLAAASLAACATAVWGSAMLFRTGADGRVWPDPPLVRLARWNLAGNLANRFTGNVDRFALLAWSSIDAVGIYGTAARWTLPIRMVSGGTKLAVAPALSRAEATAGSAGAAAAVAAFVTILALLAAVLAALSVVLLVTPWRSVTVEFQRLLSILLAAQLLGCLTLIGQVLLYYGGKSGQSAGLAAVTTVVTMGGLLWLVPRYGATGAAAAQLMASAVTLAAFVRVARTSEWATPRLFRALLIFGVVAAAPWLVAPVAAAGLAVTGAAVMALGAWTDLRQGFAIGNWSR